MEHIKIADSAQRLLLIQNSIECYEDIIKVIAETQDIEEIKTIISKRIYQLKGDFQVERRSININLNLNTE